MPKLLPLILVGGLPRSGKTAFADRLISKIDRPVKLFKEEDYVRGAQRFNRWFNPEEHKEPRANREYALNYDDYAENLLMSAMIKDVQQAAYERNAVVAESNFFCLPEYRKAFRDAALTCDHIPIYVSIFIGDKRLENNPLDKYSAAANEFFEKGNRRPKLGEGFVSMSAKEVIEHIKC